MSSKKTSQAQPLQLLASHPADIPATGAGPANTRPLRPVHSGLMFDCPDWPPRTPEVLAELTQLAASGAWGQYQAETLQRLRSQMTSQIGAQHVRLVCSGSAAIELALLACGVGAQRQPSANGWQADGLHDPVQEVICPVLDYPGNVRAVRLLGATPVLVDTVAGGWTIDADAVLAAATPRTVAVIASHLYGEIAPVQILREICDRRRWSLIEDVCQMPGGSLGSRPLGSFGHAAAWSFGGSKPLTAGCGGAITTDDDRIAQRLAVHADRPSDAFPLSPLQAAVLIPQWARLAEFVRRQRVALERLMAACRDQTPRWQWPRGIEPQRESVHYKVPVVIRPEPLAAEQSSTSAASAHAAPSQCLWVARIIQAASQCGVPAGEPFRIPQRMARSRGRIHSSANASAITTRSWLIDHRALAGDDASIDHLAKVLIGLHGQWMVSED